MKRLLRRTLYAGSAAACGIILWGAESASATDGDGGLAPVDQFQELLVDNTTSQGGTADVSNLQVNLNAPVAIGSPGANSGDVDQSNTADNSAAVVNTNATEQGVEQSQDGSADASGGDANGGGDGGDGSAVVDQGQSAGVSNATDQSGDASVDNQQLNVNIPVALRSPGANSGDVDQSNTADNSAEVINTNSTDQAAGQSQTGDATASGGDATGGYNRCNECSDGGDGGDGTAIVDQDQSASVDNGTSQGGSATVDNSQENLNGAAPRPVIVSRDGGDYNDCGCQPAPAGGDVDQSNSADDSATVINANSTEQGVRQSQTGDASASGGDASGGDNGCGCEPHSYERDGGNNGCNECSGGDGGDGGDGTAIVDQDQSARVENGTSQGGSAYVDNAQENANLRGPAPKPELERGDNNCGCESEYATFSGGGDDNDCGCRPAPSGGDVDQSNTAENTAKVGNFNETTQWVGQSQDGTANASGGDANGGGDGGDGTAVVDQDQWAGVSNWTDQSGDAAVDNYQFNINEPAKDRKNGSKGCGCDRSGRANGGDVSQSNWADNDALVVNSNETGQSARQSQTGDANGSGGDASGGYDRCGCEPTYTTFSGGGDNNCGCKPDRKGGDGGDGTAIVDQHQAARILNGTDQRGSADVGNEQKNVNGGFGKVEQSNAAANAAALLNDNATGQAGRQRQLANALAEAV